MTPLRILQRQFALALLDRTREAPVGIRAARGLAPERRFGVYRNNVFVSLIEALAVKFPVCRELVGEEFFRAMARVFVELSPPRSPVLLEYGDDFGDFIDTFPPAAPVPYLADVARLEAARTRAYHAADADPLGVDELASLSPCTWERTRVRLHPSVQIVRSVHPIVSIFEAHARPHEAPVVENATPEDALVARPGLEVEVHRLAPGAAVFLGELKADASFEEAAEMAAAAEPWFDLVTSLTGLLVSRVIVGLSGPGCRR